MKTTFSQELEDLRLAEQDLLNDGDVDILSALFLKSETCWLSSLQELKAVFCKSRRSFFTERRRRMTIERHSREIENYGKRIAIYKAETLILEQKIVVNAVKLDDALRSFGRMWIRVDLPVGLRNHGFNPEMFQSKELIEELNDEKINLFSELAQDRELLKDATDRLAVSLEKLAKMMSK